MVVKMHHSVMDGISCILMYISMCDNPDIKDIPPIMFRFTLLQQILNLFFIPILVNLLTLKFFFFMENQDNGINSAQVREKLDRLKGSAFVHDINIDILKKKSKELNCSMNDIIMTCTSRMFKRFLVEEKGDTKTK